MASSSSSFFTASTDSVPVTQEQFNMFHSIDRSLFSRLVFDLNRDPGESTQIMALWLWLEHSERDLHFVARLLLQFPDPLLRSIADETVLALICAESDCFPFINHTSTDLPADIPLLRRMTKTGSLSLRFFFDNRIAVIRGVTRMLDQVCFRAFSDILQRLQEKKAHRLIYYADNNNNIVPNSNIIYPYVHAGFDHASDLAQFPRIGDLTTLCRLRQLDINIGEPSSGGDGCDDQKETIREYVPVDDRTIFLTFSKGYPISEIEVKEFITEKFGDNVIDYIYMQGVVSSEDQPLYARLVVRSVSDIGIVLSGKSKAKFSINGKHVWARKYVRKQVRSPHKLSSPAVSQPGSPSEPTQP